MRQFVLILALGFFILSCGQDENKKKELALKEKELALKEKELVLNEKKFSNSVIADSIQKNVTPLKPEVKKKHLEYSYSGKIGTYPIHLEFSTTTPYDCPRGGSNFEGWYYYDKMGEKNKIKISGQFCGASISFDEYTNGAATGFFSGVWGGDQIDGNWAGNGRNYEFALRSIN